MASIREITTMCKAGQVQEAYELARKDLEQQCPWAQCSMGWALYYLIKGDVESANYQLLLSHLDELKALEQLTIPNDNMIFENVLFKVASFVKSYIPPTGVDSPARLSKLFSRLRDYNFEASKGYSFLLQSFIKCDSWQEMADFIDWWNLDKLTQDDYTPYRSDNGRPYMSLAERAFIAKAKALLRLGDSGRIEEFLPQMDDLIENHSEMTYPGYFCGKMLLSLGCNQEDALRVVLPFARRKLTESWVWQLLSDVFASEPDKQMACLLRAVNCGTEETFLGKVRIKLAGLYIQQNQLDCAKYHIDKVTKCYLTKGWCLPHEVDCWSHQPWINSVTSNGNATIDYMAITDAILCANTEEAIAVVTYVDQNSHRATLIYGREKRTSQRLRIRVGIGSVLKINFITDADGRFRILSTRKNRLSSELDYAKIVEGTVRKRPDKDFAFLETTDGDFFIAPALVRKHELQDDDSVNSLIAWDYNKKRETWGWSCVSIKKRNN